MQNAYLILAVIAGAGLAVQVVVIAELRAAKAPFEMSLYSGTGHGFSHPKNKNEERANVEAIATTTRMLKELFGN